jgi:hypothetical protein
MSHVYSKPQSRIVCEISLSLRQHRQKQWTFELALHSQARASRFGRPCFCFMFGSKTKWHFARLFPNCPGLTIFTSNSELLDRSSGKPLLPCWSHHMCTISLHSTGLQGQPQAFKVVAPDLLHMSLGVSSSGTCYRTAVLFRRLEHHDLAINALLNSYHPHAMIIIYQIMVVVGPCEHGQPKAGWVIGRRACRSSAVSAIIQGVYEEALPLPPPSRAQGQPINSGPGY